MSPRALSLLLLALLLAEALPVAPAAYLDPSNPSAAVPSTIPLVDSLRDEAFARQADAVRRIDALLAARNVSLDDLPPAEPAVAFEDGVEPGTRVGGLGDWRVVGEGWRVAPGEGHNGSAAWTMTNATDGKYGTLDSMLVSPAIDLSAYPLSTGSVPTVDARAAARQQLGNCPSKPPVAVPVIVVPPPSRTCVQLGDAIPSVGTVRDAIALVVRHRYNFPERADGGQVVLFDTEPYRNDLGHVLAPEVGTYEPTPALGGDGFTGWSNWTTESFDLTPWAGKKVWIGFHVATSPRAGADPQWFSPANLPHGAPYGWAFDNVTVRAPAYPVNLKVESASGPAFLDGDQPVFTPGEAVNVTVEILNAGAATVRARAQIDVSGAQAPPSATFAKDLRPGEVWRPSVPIVADASGVVGVSARAWSAAPLTNTSLPDPTEADNARAFRFPIRSLPAFRASLAADPSMAEESAPVRLVATLANTGNVRLDLALNFTDAGRNETGAFPAADVSLAPGETRQLAWSTSSAVWGAHGFRLRVTDQDATTRIATTTYYVHSSPPPVFEALGNDSAGWSASVANVPVPLDEGWMWAATSYQPITAGGLSSEDPILLALPTADAAAKGGRFTDLRLRLRYMALGNEGDARVELANPEPVQQTVLGEHVGSAPFWSATFPVHDYGQAKAISSDTNLSWHTLEIPVDPQEIDGYVNSWGPAGPQLRVVPDLANNDPTNKSWFYLDDLRLSGVPVDGSPADRVDLVRVTGEEPYVEPGSTQTGTSVAGSQANPASPTACPWDRVENKWTMNCWRPMSRAQALAFTTGAARVHWKNLTSAGRPYALPDGTTALFAYDLPRQENPRSERLVTPPIQLVQATDPVLSFDHAYWFQGEPTDYQSPNTYSIAQVGYVDLQYLDDDGSWSPFYRLTPDGGYHSALEQGGSEDPRTPIGPSSFRASDGWEQPGPCVAAGVCDRGGYVRNKDANGSTYWTSYPYPLQNHSTFHLAQLANVNLSNRLVRVGFHAAGPLVIVNGGASWAVANVRITPVSRFAVDGAIDRVALATPYDWRAIGVGPGTSVPVNVTLRNAGLFAERFTLRVNLSVVQGATLPGREQDLGYLAPGETQNVLLQIPVPAGEDVRYVLRAQLAPSLNTTRDENAYNDNATVGADGSLVARSRYDAAVSALVFPTKGVSTLARFMPIVVQNLGNEPLDDLVVTRTLERLSGSGRQLVGQARWTLARPLEPNPVGVPLQALAPDPAVSLADLFAAPGDTGSFAATVRVDAGPFDADPGNDVRTLGYSASDPLASEGFEGSQLAWDVSDPSLWSEGPGYASAKGLQGGNASSGAIPASTDAWAASRAIPLASAKNGVVNLVARYDLEPGYDGARFEITNDGGATWIPLDPMTPEGLQGTYPGTLTSANPLATGPGDAPGALTGDSHAAPLARDGWVPLSFNLLRVPQLTESVTFQDLRAASAFAPSARERSGDAYVAPGMVVDPTREGARWEIRNETEGVRARSGNAWWSGYATRTSRLARDFDVHGVDANDTVYLEWWDWRAGRPGAPDGVGAVFTVNLTQEGPAGPGSEAFVGTGVVATLAQDGAWTRYGTSVKPELLNRSKLLHVEFRLDPTYQGDDRGWLLDDVKLVAGRVAQGVLRATPLTLPDEEADHASWTVRDGSWARVAALPATQAPWVATVVQGPNGLDAPAWRLDLARANETHVDARLVTPVVDLSDLVGSVATLQLTHAYDLAFDAPTNSYQGGAVEVSVLNRTTGRWDPWRQLFAEGQAPKPQLGEAVDPGAPRASGGLPYTRVLPNVGDSFERFARYAKSYAYVGNSGKSADLYYRNETANVSFAFSGVSAGYRTDAFDLTDYAGEAVRFAFHAWTSPKDAAARDRSWTLASAQVVGSVLSTRDAKLRVRLATDGSILPGRIQIDQFEVAGTPYAHSVGLELDPLPPLAEPFGVVNVTGRLVNHGPQARQLVGVALLNSTLTPYRAVRVLSPKPGVAPVAPAVGVSGPFELGPAGSATDRAAFAFQAYVGAEGSAYDVRLQAVELTPGGALAPDAFVDDVPGRTHHEARVVARARNQTLLDAPAPAPASLAGPGEVVVAGTGLVNGTLPLDVTVHLEVRLNRTLKATRDAHVGARGPGDRFAYAFDPLRLDEAGNYTFALTPTGGPSVERLYRVARNDTAYGTSFEDGNADWTLGAGAQVADDDAHEGRRSLLLGLADAAYAGGERLVGAQAGATLADVDLAGLGDAPVLSFWSKTLFDRTGNARVTLTLLDEAGGAVAGCAQMPLLAEPLHGRSTSWQLVQAPLPHKPGCDLRSHARFDFAIDDAYGQGWRVDALTLSSGLLQVAPGELAATLVDSAAKTYRYEVRNPGLVPRDVDVVLDLPASQLAPAQAAWMRAQPASFRLAPGETREVDVRVEAPPARGAFPQDLRAVFELVDRATPHAPVPLNLSVAFRPLARPDLAVAASVDGHPLDARRAPVEEAVPHQLNALVANQGEEPSLPTVARLEVIDDATGALVWSATQPVPALAPLAEAEVSAVVTGSWKPLLGQRGNFTFRVVVDPAHDLVDYDRSNDDVRFPLEVVRLVRPDVVVAAGTFVVANAQGLPLHEATPDELLRIGALVENRGLADAHDVTVRLLANGALLKEETIPVLRVGETRAMRANQFAPNASTRYTVFAFTTDLELLSDNNEQSLDLPVFPAEIALDGEGATARLVRDGNATLRFALRDDGPYPVDLELRLPAGSSLARVSPAEVQLAPNERVEVALELRAPASQPAGNVSLPLKVYRDGILVAQRTVDVVVEASPAALLAPDPVAGPPQSLNVTVDVVNLGNVGLAPTLRLLDEDGSTLGETSLAALPLGRSSLARFAANVSPQTPPGVRHGSVALVQDGRVLNATPVDIEVLPWSRLDVATRAPNASSAQPAYEVRVAYDGNVGDVVRPRVLGLPPGVSARVEPEQLRLDPGDAANVRVVLDAADATPTGLYNVQLALAGTRTLAAKPALAPLALDLRAAHLVLDGLPDAANLSATDGSSLAFAPRVLNDGDGASAPLLVGLYVDGVLVDAARVPSLAPGASAPARLAWKATPGAHGVIVALDPHGPHAHDAPAWSRPVLVAASGVPGADLARRVDAPGLALALLALAALAFGRDRRRAR